MPSNSCRGHSSSSRERVARRTPRGCFSGWRRPSMALGRFKESVENYTRAFDLFERCGDIDNALRMLEQPLILAEKGADATGLLQKAIGLVPGTLRAEALGGKYGLAVYHATGDYQRATA